MPTFSKQAIRLPYLIIPASSITTSYVAIGTLSNPIRLIKFKNQTNGTVDLTYNPSMNMISLVAGEVDSDNICSNAPSNADVFDEVAGRQYWVKWQGSAPGSPTGNVIIELICASTGG